MPITPYPTDATNLDDDPNLIFQNGVYYHWPSERYYKVVDGQIKETDVGGRPITVGDEIHYNPETLLPQSEWNYVEPTGGNKFGVLTKVDTAEAFFYYPSYNVAVQTVGDLAMVFDFKKGKVEFFNEAAKRYKPSIQVDPTKLGRGRTWSRMLGEYVLDPEIKDILMIANRGPSPWRIDNRPSEEMGPGVGRYKVRPAGSEIPVWWFDEERQSFYDADGVETHAINIRDEIHPLITLPNSTRPNLLTYKATTTTPGNNTNPAAPTAPAPPNAQNPPLKFVHGEPVVPPGHYLTPGGLCVGWPPNIKKAIQEWNQAERNRRKALLSKYTCIVGTKFSKKCSC